MSIFDIGLLNTSYTGADALSLGDPLDRYRFDLTGSPDVNLSFAGGIGSFDWQLEDSNGQVVREGSTGGTHPDIVPIQNLPAGTYWLQAQYAGVDTPYTLTLDPLTGSTWDSGVFTVESKGTVGFDYLLDGGGYRGQIGIFSLTGMAAFAPNSPEFTQEAARRALSGTTEGHIVIDDRTEGAKFSASFPWEDDFNRGEYLEVKTFEMTPGDLFGVILVPSGTIQDIFENPFLEGKQQPLFSMATSSPNDIFYFGQIADVTGDGRTFTLEDLQIGRSDRDYNDIVFRVTGANGTAPGLDGIINPNKDWRNDPIGVELRDYVNTPPQFLEFPTQPVYLAGQPIAFLDVTVRDENGDLIQVSFLLRKEGEDWQSLTPENEFTWHEDWATFDYDLPGLAVGNYQLKAIAVDGAGKTSQEILRAFEVRSTNTAPNGLDFTLPEGQFNSGETVELIGGTVYDAEGANDIVKVDFALRQENGEWVDIADAIEFTSDDRDSQKLAFNYTLNLENFGSGNYELRGMAIDRLGATSNSVIRSFSIVGNEVVNLAPSDLQFDVYTVGDQVKITGGKVYDPNGVIDLSRVDFQIQKEGGEWQDVSDAASFIADSQDSRWASFNYSLDGLKVGNYKLQATAYDLDGNPSNVAISDFAIELPNQAPEDLRFSIYPLYTNAETISFSGARVTDADGVSNLDEVEYLLLGPNNIWYDIPDVTEFTTDNRGRGRFSYSYDLTGLPPGSYTLYGIARDKTGALSNPVEQPFTIISDSGEALSDTVRFAIAESANFSSYSAEELAQTRDWIVWVTPGYSATDLAAQIGASNLGETGHIPNTYTFQFADDVTPDTAWQQLRTLPGIELSYPDVPVDLRLLHTPTDFHFNRQWNLLKNLNSNEHSSMTKAWDLRNPLTGLPIRGNGVQIAIVDDGIDTSHHDFKDKNPFIDRYREDLSWDYSDDDNDPSPRSKRTFTANLSNSEVDSIEGVTFELPSSLTGVVNQVELNLEFASIPDLPRPQDLTIYLYSPDETIFSPENWRRGRGSGIYFPGRDDLNFKEETQVFVQDDGSLYFDQVPFYKSYAGGNWNLKIVNPGEEPYTEEILKKIQTELIKSWSLTIETDNPHGTAVAGLALGRENGTGIVGVAPNAELANLRLIGNIDAFTNYFESTDSRIADALFDFDRNREIDIFNNSWGIESMTRPSLAIAALESESQAGRQGLGNIYIFSAGNDGEFYGNVNYNSLTNSRHAIAVGAVARNGEFSSYSTPGTSVFVSAFSSSGRLNDKKNDIVTIGSQNLGNGFVTDFGGTSAAAPQVSGLTALMLDANGQLTPRDVQHILAETSYPSNLDLSQLSPFGWQQNGAGYFYSPQYGFGVIDPVEAVDLAMNWELVGEEVQVTSGNINVGDEILDNDLLNDTTKIDRDIAVEHVEVSLFAKHQDWRDLEITLISPDGTKSVLSQAVPPLPGAVQTSPKIATNTPWVFTSVAHWGESSKGEWKLEVRDNNGNGVEGDWNSWELNLYGTENDFENLPNIVTNTNDSGVGSLRSAIEWSNSNPGKDSILFDIPTTDPGYNESTQTFSIRPTSALPTITDAVIVDGTSQQGFASKPIIELDGTNAGAGSTGLFITGGNTTVKGLVINRFPFHGIYLSESGENIIEGNYIGTDVTGTIDLGNLLNGVVIKGNTNSILNNLISGNNLSGITIVDGSLNRLSANKIGTDITGNQDVGNSLAGVEISGDNNFVGVSMNSENNNLVSGNDVFGLSISGSNNLIEDNLIGLNIDRSFYIPNNYGVYVDGVNNSFHENYIEGNSGRGVFVHGTAHNFNVNFIKGNSEVGVYLGQASSILMTSNEVSNNGSDGIYVSSLASNNKIGNTDLNDSNQISNNLGSGVVVVSSHGNSLLYNNIFDNTGLGIDLGNDGVTLNDLADSDEGSNYLQNYPVLSSAISQDGGTIIQGTLNSTPNTTFRVEIFRNTSLDSSGYGEGESRFDSLDVTTDSNGNVSFNLIHPFVIPAGEFITATATDANGNTSEFSQGILVDRILADSVQDFSLTQGQNNWYYGYYDGNLTSSDFKQFTAIDSNEPNVGWIVDGTDYFNSTYWTIIGPTETHPSGLALSTRTSDEQWATRRWISEVGGTINLSGTLKKMDTTGGNGVIGRIYVDGVEVWSQEIAANDGVGVNYNFNTTVNPGSTVDFVLDPKDSEQFNDRSIFTGVVTKVVGAIGVMNNSVTRD